jgi:hypothetical protein
VKLSHFAGENPVHALGRVVILVSPCLTSPTTHPPGDSHLSHLCLTHAVRPVSLSHPLRYSPKGETGESQTLKTLLPSWLAFKKRGIA